MPNNDNRFWQSPLGLAVVGGLFAIGGIFVTWYLNKPLTPEPINKPTTAELIAQREAEEKERKYQLVKSCTQTAKGRLEAAVMADALLNAVKSGSQSISGNAQADALCRKSDFINPLNLDTGFTQTFYWIEDTSSAGAKAICRCSN